MLHLARRASRRLASTQPTTLPNISLGTTVTDQSTSAHSSLSPFEQAVYATRFLSADGVEKANSGHPGTPMGLATIGVEIFANHLRHDPGDPHWLNRDRFVLSCGHASMLIYSLLHLAGYDLSLDDLKSFRQWGSKTPGHPEYHDTPGVEITTGPLGQGLSSAVGMALAAKMAGARVNAPDAAVIDYKVYVLASDGDLMEGVANEACSIAGHHRLDNLIVFYDDNNITIDGKAEISFSEDVAARFVGLGWSTEKIDGHDQGQIAAALERAQRSEKPTLIVAKTHIAIGAPTKQDTPGAHGAPLGRSEIDGAKKAAGWPTEPTFFVPEDARKAFAAGIERGKAACAAWQKLVAGLSGAQKAAYLELTSAEVPGDILDQLVAEAGDKPDATRGHGGRIQQKVAALVPRLVGGSADLNASVKTRIKDGADVTAADYSGRNISFGVREHGMGAVLNGLALSGLFIPFGSTFLIFSDYMRPPMRLAALMKQQVVYVFSHDSIFLGEDGPTHQPVEQLWGMRLVPNLDVVRPADAVECAGAWAHAALRKDGPTVIVLSRQTVPVLKRSSSFQAKDMLDGAYVLADAAKPDLVLIATGSEVGDAVQVKQLLEKEGKQVRVVSMPCVDAFLRLPQDKRDAILPPGIRRASFELGVTGPWKALTGLDGIEVGVNHFGASAPAERLQQEFGVSAPQVAAQILAALD